MAENSFHVEVRNVIDLREDIVTKLDLLVETSGEDARFVKNPDGSVACYVKYRRYKLAVRVTIDEFFERIMQRGENISDVLYGILREKVSMELLIN